MNVMLVLNGLEFDCVLVVKVYDCMIINLFDLKSQC